MRFHYEGKYSGDPETLPAGEHKPGAVKFKEPEDAKKLGLIANGIALVLLAITLTIFFLVRYRSFGPGSGPGGVDSAMNHWSWWVGVLCSILFAVPHEFLHASCFKEDVYMYTNLKQGMLFVVGPEDMSKGRFIFMSLLPNLVFGFIPLAMYCIAPSLLFFGALGAFSIPMGAGDYLNVFNALTQMPKGARTYLHKFHSYWYMPEGEDA